MENAFIYICANVRIGYLVGCEIFSDRLSFSLFCGCHGASTNLTWIFAWKIEIYRTRTRRGKPFFIVDTYTFFPKLNIVDNYYLKTQQSYFSKATSILQYDLTFGEAICFPEWVSYDPRII